MAGASNCAKLRATGRQQWFGQQDAPSLQTMSFNTALDEDGKSGVGMIAFNDSPRRDPKIKVYNPKLGMDSLVVAPIS